MSPIVTIHQQEISPLHHQPIQPRPKPLKLYPPTSNPPQVSLPRAQSPHSPKSKSTRIVMYIPFLLPFTLSCGGLVLMADHPKMAIKSPQILDTFLSLCPLRPSKNPATNLRCRRRHNNQL